MRKLVQNASLSQNAAEYGPMATTTTTQQLTILSANLKKFLKKTE